MNTLRVSLLVVGVILVIGIYLFQSRTSATYNQNSKFRATIGRFISFISHLIHSSCISLKNNFRRPFNVDDDFVDKAHNHKHLEPALSDEQLENMNNMIANKPVEKTTPLSETTGDMSSNHKSIDSPNMGKSTQPVSAEKSNELLITLTVLPKPGNIFYGGDILQACKLAGLQLGEFNIFHRYALIDEKVLMTPVCSLVNLFEPGYFDFDCMDDFTTEGLSLFMQLPGPVDGRDAFLILMDVSDKLSVNLNATICDETRSVLTTQTISHIKEKVENFRFKLKMDALKNN